MSVADCFDHDPGLIPVAKAREQLRARIRPSVQEESVPLHAAKGRILSKPLLSPNDIPSFDNVAVDGWAFAWSGDMAHGPFSLEIEEGRAAAGHPFCGNVRPGAALRVLTGAVLPDGCDTIVLQEESKVADGRVHLPSLAKGFTNKRPAGEDMRAGETVLESGHRLRAQDIGAAALMGFDCLPVFEPLKVAIFSTGDEILQPGENPKAGTLFDANRPILASMLKELPVRLEDLGRLPDNPALIRATLQEAARTHSLILTSGGASMGDEDHLAQSLQELGMLRFWRIAIKPGRPLAFGEIGNCLILGLPGNPVAATLCFAYLARPLLLSLAGSIWQEPIAVPLPMNHSLKKRKGRTELVRVRLVHTNAGPKLERIKKQGSGVLTSLVEADGIAELGPDIETIEAGDPVPFLSFEALGLA